MRLVKTIPARWFSLVALAAAAAPAVKPPPSGLAPLVRAYRETPTPAKRAAVEAYATEHARQTSGILARLALGITDYEQKNFPSAIANLKPLPGKLPQIADYVAYYLGAARVESQDLAGIAGDLAPAHRADPASPFDGRAWVLEARALQPADAAQAVRLLRDHYSRLPQPAGWAMTMRCWRRSSGSLSSIRNRPGG